METQPTVLSQEQYNNSMYAVTDNGDMWLLYASLDDGEIDECLWLGNDIDAWDNLLGEVGAENCESTEITVDGEDLPAIACNVGDRGPQIDLDSLRNGYVIWYSAM